MVASIPIVVVVTFFLHQRWVSSSSSCSSVAAWLTNTCYEKDNIRIHFWRTVSLVSCFCCYLLASSLADLTSSHLPAVHVLPGHIAFPWKTIAVWLLLHLVLAVAGYIQRGVIVAPILHKAKFISMELRKGEHRFGGDCCWVKGKARRAQMKSAAEVCLTEVLVAGRRRFQQMYMKPNVMMMVHTEPITTRTTKSLL